MCPEFIAIYPALARAHLGAPGGALATARRAVQAALRYASGTGFSIGPPGVLFSRRYPGLRSPALLAQALLRARAGADGAARSAFERSIDAARQQGAPLHEADALVAAAAFLEGRDDERRLRYLERARALRDGCGVQQEK
jgi:hypothetical protein